MHVRDHAVAKANAGGDLGVDEVAAAIIVGADAIGPTCGDVGSNLLASLVDRGGEVAPVGVPEQLGEVAGGPVWLAVGADAGDYLSSW